MTDEQNIQDLAFSDWQAGMKYKDIAKKYDVNINTVKSWATRHWKKKVSQVATTIEEVATQKKTRGAPLGNKNAVGNQGGAPLGNQNNFIHGAYSRIYWDSLDETELQLLGSPSFTEEMHLEEQLALLTIRERRLMLRIQQFQEKTGESSLESTVEESETTKTSKISFFDAILKLEHTLTQVQSKKTKTIEMLHRIRQERLDREEKSKNEEKNQEELGDLSQLSDEELREIERILQDTE